jgi:hypothetical protein
MHRQLSVTDMKLKRKTLNQIPSENTLTRKVYDSLINDGFYVRTKARYKTEYSIITYLRDFYNMKIISQGTTFVYLG